MKRQNKSKVPQAQNWNNKTSPSRAASKKKKVINAQVQAQAQTKAIPHYNHQQYYQSIKWPKSAPFFGIPTGSIPPLTMQDILNFWQSVQNMSQPPMAHSEILDDVELLLAFLTHKLGGNLLIDWEELENFYKDVIQNSGIGSGTTQAFLRNSFQHGLNFDTRQKYLMTRSGLHKPKLNINDIVKEDHQEEILQLKALLADGTELRIPRKNFMKAIQEDIQLEVLTEHDEDFVVIRRK